MISRRQFIIFSGVCGGVSVSSQTLGIDSLKQNDCVNDYKKLGLELMTPEDDPQFGNFIRGIDGATGGMSVGTGRARNEDIATAFKLLFNRDVFQRGSNEGAFGVAKYLNGIEKRNEDGLLFKQEWGLGDQPANPLIVCLFGSTNTAPSEGDETSWCAAFVNFCIMVAGKVGTGRALSGSFREYGNKIDDPKPGDLVVFSQYGDNGKRGKGHVGFFSGFRDEQVIVLGGNQGTNGKGMISEVPFKLEGKSLYVDSFRRIPE